MHFHFKDNSYGRLFSLQNSSCPGVDFYWLYQMYLVFRRISRSLKSYCQFDRSGGSGEESNGEEIIFYTKRRLWKRMSTASWENGWENGFTAWVSLTPSITFLWMIDHLIHGVCFFYIPIFDTYRIQENIETLQRLTFHYRNCFWNIREWQKA